MTVTTLGAEHPTQVLERQQLTVGMYAAQPAELLVLGDPAPEVGRQGTQVVVPRAALSGDLRVHVRPLGSEAFGPGSRVKLTLRAGAAGSDAVSVSADLSGRTGADLLVLRPLAPDHLQVTLVRQPDPLSELATATRAATGRALAAAGLRPLPQPVRLHLDRSPSTTPWWTSGAMTSVVDALVGVAAAVSEAA
ncbi:hypothetical protein, partial [Desertihabitans aurantiacus]|uniref:hypothetical protein n=1 Tax=Desertihabitans aurantiacus TaxID=2282477 RepID=UPI001300287C